MRGKPIQWMLIGVLCAPTDSFSVNRYTFTKPQALTPEMIASNKVSITFTGSVKSIELLGKRELDVIPLDLDPKFAVTVHIAQLTPSDVPLKEGAGQVFAIHSPARLFRGGAASAIGRNYKFKITWEQVNETPRFSQMTATPIKD